MESIVARSKFFFPDEVSHTRLTRAEPYCWDLGSRREEQRKCINTRTSPRQLPSIATRLPSITASANTYHPPSILSNRFFNDITPVNHPSNVPSHTHNTKLLNDTRTNLKMCNFEQITYHCRHQIIRRYSYCHFARNDPVHACFGVKVLKREWYQDQADCDDCIRQ
ncbi:MAG: hypothetical protein Q9221_007442 [Calogaya cf. arnoldii]